MGKKKTKIGQCVYCSETKLLTREHMVPKCLFPDPKPNLITVPVCTQCNHNKSKDDDYLRDILVVDFNTANNVKAQALLSGKVIRSASRNLSAVIRTAKTEGQFEATYSPGGIYLGHGYAFPIEVERVNRSFSLMVRGLYFKTTGKLLPKDCQFDVRRLTPLEFEEYTRQLDKIGYNGPYVLGEDVFKCIFVYAAEEPALTKWTLIFYDGICIQVNTAPSTHDLATCLPLTAKE